jgi:hypothetical protein
MGWPTTALQHNLTFVTRDTASIATGGVAVFNPWAHEVTLALPHGRAAATSGKGRGLASNAGGAPVRRCSSPTVREGSFREGGPHPANSHTRFYPD